MKIIMIGMDPQLLDPESETSKRINFYRTAVDDIRVFVLESYGKSALGKISSFFRTWRETRRILKSEDFNILSTQDPFVTGLIGYFLKLEFKICLQIQIHTGLFTPYFWMESEKNRIYVRLAKLILTKADCVKVVSQSIKRYLVETFAMDSSKIVVLPVFIDFDLFLQAKPKIDLKKKFPEFDFIIMMASRLVKQKNISLAIEVFAKLVDKYPKMGLLIVGIGPEEIYLRREISRLKLEMNVRIESWTDDMASYYKAVDLFLLTSIYEGFARTVLEAMACGLPVIMSDVGVAGEILINGRNGIVVPVNNKNALCGAIEDIYLNEDKRTQIALAAHQTIIELPWRHRDMYLNFYKKSFKLCDSH